ncbi:hypothetical protein O0544_15820 [Edwardsiella anguillarum]|nr:hypothetical protein [Edwardsiella piscicida]MDA6077283.1 hypothetical protein [Edwardsiella anguillarum]WCF13491.1 hypothetical protein N4G58_06950 [Edwardsiella piscicida]
MKKVTIALAAVAMLLTLSMNRVLHADEVVTHNDFLYRMSHVINGSMSKMGEREN